MKTLKLATLLLLAASCGEPKVQIEVQDENRKHKLESLHKELQSHGQTTEQLVEIYEKMEKMIHERLKNQYERMRKIDMKEVELKFREKGCKAQ